MTAKWSLFCPATGQRHDVCVCGSCLAQCPSPPPEEPEVMEPEVEVIDLASKREVEALIDLEPEAGVIDLELDRSGAGSGSNRSGAERSDPFAYPQLCVVPTDKDDTLINAVKAVFPSADSLICTWHINKMILAKAKPLIRFELVYI